MMTFEEWFREQYGSHQKGFGLCEADLKGAWLARDIEIERLRTVVDAAQEWSGDRAVRDWGDADLMKALWTFNGDNTEPCPECDGECWEPCAPCTVANAHASIDATLDDLVKRGKLYRGEPIPGLGA